jgi:hypothetical protein
VEYKSQSVAVNDTLDILLEKLSFALSFSRSPSPAAGASGTAASSAGTGTAAPIQPSDFTAASVNRRPSTGIETNAAVSKSSDSHTHTADANNSSNEISVILDAKVNGLFDFIRFIASYSVCYVLSFIHNK